MSFLRTGSYQDLLTFLALILVLRFLLDSLFSPSTPKVEKEVPPPSDLSMTLNLTACLSAKHTWPPLLCPQVLRPHVTVVEVAVCHPVHYINRFGRRPRASLGAQLDANSGRHIVMYTPPASAADSGRSGGAWCSTSWPAVTQISPPYIFIIFFPV